MGKWLDMPSIYAFVVGRNRRLLILAFLVGWAWTAWIGVHSDGWLLDDEITHALIAHEVWRDPSLLLNVWGRPANTLAYLLPSYGAGLELRRCAALLMTACIGLLAISLAGHMGLKRTWLVALCFWFQPWVSDVGYQSITEIPFALLLLAAAWRLQRHRPLSAALLVGALPLVRHEGALFVALFILLMAVTKRPVALGLSLLPMVGYNVAHAVVFGLWPSGNLADWMPTREYGHGTWFHFLPLALQDIGWPVAGLCLVTGLRLALTRQPAGWLYVPYVLYVLAHVVIYRFGLYASGGYGVFLFPIAPLAAIAAAECLEQLGARLAAWARTLGRLGIATAVLCLLACSVAMSGFRTQPRSKDELAVALEQTATWLQAHATPGQHVTRHAEPPHVIAVHPAFWLFFNPRWPDYAASLEADGPDRLAVGDFVVWDSKYGERHSLHLNTLTDTNRYLLCASFGRDAVRVFQRR